MNRNFRLLLFVTMIVFATVISFGIATVNHLHLQHETLQYQQNQIAEIEEKIKRSMMTIDKAYHLFDDETANDMKANTEQLIKWYEENPDLDSWDFAAIKEEFGMDVYFINEDLVVTHSSFTDDIGLNFYDCCTKLVPILENRRKSGDFYHDGIDIEQSTGQIKKYSYMATPDGKYLIELGVNLEHGKIFKEFNFLAEIEDILASTDCINDINIFNIAGFSLGEPRDVGTISSERRAAFKKTLQTGQKTELTGKWNGEPATYRYIRYSSSFDSEVTKHRVIEINYNNQAMEAVYKDYTKTFFIQLVIVLVVTVLLAAIISKRVSRPMYLAFHDSLTGLKNRAAFEETLPPLLRDKKNKTALLMIDLDNFKQVNDRYGHDKGDMLLKSVAKELRQSIRKEDKVFRLGGDEFAVVLTPATKSEAEATASRIIDTIHTCINNCPHLKKAGVTASIGIAFAPEHGTDVEGLYKKADIALYDSKEKGKNCYSFYRSDMGESGMAPSH
ncbi:GGDEF domain-containing protein [Aliibacillus thermotolerans]|uniref:GGDEF domain-containing protein n=1 Tax=Aliibacillus thermotolerans TaxID=1834418 RepID=A0ABW0U5N6_9BACI|nr:GGDEF domain-containing protein [Aliibacillus thermotolerans]MDA3128526.1 diguanylate cyclase [Aliibacillus thermotolerans]